MDRPEEMWVLSRPHNWRPRTVVEELLRVNLQTGTVTDRTRVSSRFAHDAVRLGDHVYIASTGDGCVVELELPACNLVHKHQLFTPQEHINAVAPVGNGSMWVLLHNRGESDIVLVDLKSGMQAVRHKHVGMHAHGLVVWCNVLLVLDSAHSALVRVDSVTGQKQTLWQAAGEGKFLKGLAVVDGVAYFGISPLAERSMRADPRLSCELAAFHLKEERLLWMRKVPTHGLLNTIAAPHLSEASTYRAVVTGQAKPAAAAPLGFENTADVIGGHWASGAPYLKSDLKIKWDPARAERGSLTCVQLVLLKANVTDLKAAVLGQGEALWDAAEQRRSNAYLKGRAQNTQRYKPGTEEVLLIFSDKRGEAIYRFPYYARFQHVLEPLLEQVLGKGEMGKIMRLHLARVLPGSLIHIHRDRGGYVERGHRIHVPLQADPSTLAFLSCPTARPHAISPSVTAADALRQGCLPLQIEEGLVFEINNAVAHLVHNPGNASRIHLIVDVSEHAFPPATELRPGQQCAYKGQLILC